ncbi:MAG: hypothetical protein A3F18_00895 [Legionellales bacterium RIFCSPHIGHO2_12_FULL_37_14]|nr:MAG: hypothetical protein A3F18_00895 [Legionellales bacterium RIFCSPHIGHO2_12_FULL_37_14]
MINSTIKNQHDNVIQLWNGRQIGFAEYGHPQGQPVLYFHGFPGSRLEIEPFHDIALTQAIRIISIDRPGMGLSTLDKDRTLLSWADDIIEFTDILQLKSFSIIGHSGGAPFVAACAFSIPEKINTAVIVSGMAPFDNPDSHVGMASAQLKANKLIKKMPWLAYPIMWLNKKMLQSPKMLEKMIQQLPAVDQLFFQDEKKRAAIVNNVLEAFRNGVIGPAQEMQLLLTKTWGFQLDEIRCPVIIWQGSIDTQVPISHAKIYANLIQNAQLNLIENEGHHSLINNHMFEILESLK